MSTLDKLHDQAMEKAFFADLERRKGNEEQAAKLFEKALALEREAIAEMTNPVEPTWSILHRSAGWLALDCYQPHLAEQLASTALDGIPPTEIAEELRDFQKQASFQNRILWKNKTVFSDKHINSSSKLISPIIQRDIHEKIWIFLSISRMCGKRRLSNINE